MCRNFFLFGCLCSYSILIILGLATLAAADMFEWTDPVSGNFKDAGNWTNTTGADLPPPDAGDEVELNEAGTYTISLTRDEASDVLRGLDGNVTFASDSAMMRTFELATGEADAHINGGSIQIGTATNPVSLQLPNVTSGGGLNISVMNIGSTADGTVSVVGPDSLLDVLGATDHHLGLDGNHGTLIVSDGPKVNYGVNGTLNVGDASDSGSQGTVMVATGSRLNTGHIDIAAQTSGATGTMTVQGDDSSIHQTLAGANLVVGSAAGGTGTINVQSGAQFHTGTGTTTVNATGTINIDGYGSTFWANDNVVIDGGTLSCNYRHGFRLPVAKSLTAQNNASVEFAGFGYDFEDRNYFYINSGADLSSTGYLNIGYSLSNGTLIVDGIGSTLTTGDVSYWGDMSGAAYVTIRNEATADLAEINLGSEINSFGDLYVQSGADVTVDTLRIGMGGGIGYLRVLGSTVTQNGSAELIVGGYNVNAGAGNLEVSAGTFTTGTGNTIVDNTGIISIRSGGTFNLNGPISGDGVFRLSESSGWQLNVNDPTQTVGFGPSRMRIGGLTNATLPLFDPTVGMSVAGSAIVDVGGHLSIEGATLSLGGLIVASGGRVTYQSGSFETGPLQGAIGSVLDIRANVSLGDPGAVNGFGTAGTVHVQDNVVTLQDANDAVFDSMTLVTLGNGGNSGSVAAANGLTLDFGGNITGLGTVDTPNNSSKPLVNNGNITGNSPNELITITGYMKGVGTCDNCNITGTDAPGFSTAAVNRGSVSYNGSLEIEIGGPTPGSEFDQLNHILGAGVADLGGALDVTLMGSYTPSIGDTFQIISATSVADRFDVENLPDPGGLDWNLVYGATDVVLQVVTPFSADFDQDGDVDLNDLAQWEGDFGGPGSDADGDGDSDGADVLAWQQQFGSVAGALTSSQTVPEPSAVLLLSGLAAVSILAKRGLCAV
jgi:hypothetical protein